jgi:uncharacterized membrane protein YesL
LFAGLRAWWRGIRHLQHRGYTYIWANVLWFILSLPVVTAPAAWAGMIRLSRTAYLEPQANLDDFWAGFRENLKRGAVLAAVNVVIFGLTWANLTAYQTASGTTFNVARIVWTLALLLWVTVQLYLWPIFYAMETPNLRGALRNALVMLVLNPLFTLGFILGVAVIVAFSIAFFAAWPLLTGGALAAVSTAAVFDRLEAAGFRKGQPSVFERDHISQNADWGTEGD